MYTPGASKPLSPSLLDLSFAMMVFFMFITFFATEGEKKQQSNEFSLPPVSLVQLDTPGTQSTTRPGTPVTIANKGSGLHYSVGEKTVPLSGLGNALKKISAVNVNFRVEGSVPYKALIQAIEVCQSNNMETFTLVVTKPRGTP